MKNLDLLQEAIKMIENGNSETATARLKQFITLNTPRVKSAGKLKIYDWADVKGKQFRRNIQGVFHDSEAEAAVATDLHAILVSKPDYVAENAGEVILKNGDKIEFDPGFQKFPAWRRVFYENRREFKVDREKVARMLTQERADKKLGKIYFAFNVGTSTDPKYLCSANCKLLLTLPEDGKFYVSAGENSEVLALQYESEDGNYKALLMHMHVKPEFIGQDAIIEE